MKKVKDFRTLVKREVKHLEKSPLNINLSDFQNTEYLEHRLGFLNGSDDYIAYLERSNIGPAALTETEELRFILKHEREGQEDNAELISSQYYLLINKINYHELLKESNEMKVKYNRLVKLADGLKAVMNETYK